MDDYIFNIGIYAYLGIRYLPMLKIQILLGLFTSRLYGNYHLLIPDMSKNPYRNHPTSIDRPLANGGGRVKYWEVEDMMCITYYFKIFTEFSLEFHGHNKYNQITIRNIKLKQASTRFIIPSFFPFLDYL